MPTPSSSQWFLAGVALLVGWGCGSTAEPNPPFASVPPRLELLVQRGDVATPVMVALRQLPRTRGERLSGVQGRIHFDPAVLRYVGQVRSDSAIVFVEASAESEGRLRLAGFAPRGMPDEVVVFVFASRAQGSIVVEYEPEVTAELGGAQRREPGRRVRGRPGAVATSGPAARLELEDWISLLGPRQGSSDIAKLAGEGRTYGDADLSGAPDINDALLIAQVSVQTAPLLADPLTDVAIAGNVEPANLPGLGEPDDTEPPGREFDGSYLVNVLDALEVANFTVSLPAGVVGQVIPGRDVPAAIDTLPAVVTADLELGRATLHRLVGRVIVPRGVTLRIVAGARLEAAPAGGISESGQLVIRQGGRIEVRGTRLLPVVMTCDAAARVPGCWRGLIVNGAALLNNDGVSGNVFGCPVLYSPDAAGVYGGCLNQDDSGILRYLRIEFAGRAPSDPVPGAGLALNGVGSGTVIDSIQVYGSSSSGLSVSGGRAQLRNLVITNSVGSGLRWADGWQGKIQELLIQHGAPSAMPAIEGANFGLAPDAGPRSAPTIWNASIVGREAGGESRPVALLLRDGTAATLRNAIVTGFSTGADIDGDASCARTIDSLTVGTSIFDRNTRNGDEDVDCVDEAAYLSAAARGNTFQDPQLTAAFTTSFDLRPIPSGPAATGAAPPADGFLDPTLIFTGGVAPANVSRSNVPWYAGWIRQTNTQLLAVDGAN